MKKEDVNEKIGGKVLKMILYIILILILLIVINTLRNYIIITDLQTKMLNYKYSTNYHVKTTTEETKGVTVKANYYKKDNKQTFIVERKKDGKTSKVSLYNNGEKTDMFTETEDSKSVRLNVSQIMDVELTNGLETENSWQTFFACVISRVKPVNCNGKECYLVNGYISATSLVTENTSAYISKDTGLYLKIDQDGITSNREYEFGNVSDSVFTEPDVSQYTLKTDE